MTNDETKSLCMSIMLADTEDAVIQILKAHQYWDDDKVWRYFDDNENNYSSIGNQQASPDAALVEKIVNSVDARLMNECMVAGMDPESEQAPTSIGEAVKQFFGGTGRIRDWTNSERTEIAKGITVSATGYRAGQGNPCFSIADCGEGQTPNMMPLTFLSLTKKSNKLKIPFVQGKFNMGGTGVLTFCGHHNLQFILSRRNQILAAMNPKDQSDYDWGFTVVRRIDPNGKRRNSMYVYLAPEGSDVLPGRGNVLHFGSISMPIFPEDNKPYKREATWGSLIKLYEYSGFKSHILMKDGLLRRIDLLLPEVALPVRFHECREGFRGVDDRSYATNLTGLIVRMEDDKSNNLEEGFPSSFNMCVDGEPITGVIYAFKKKKAETYRKSEGVIFTMNGQTQGHLHADFFKRARTVGLSYLADSLLVIVDCSKISGRSREDLFMNSRDRLSNIELRKNISDELALLLKNHEGLRQLKEQRRREEVENLIGDSKPLEKIIETVIQKSPSLATMFLKGSRISNPFKSKGIKEDDTPFKGKRYPTYFKFAKFDKGKVLHRDCHINYRSRIAFETDADNDYFSRDTDQGEFTLTMNKDGKKVLVESRTLILHNGIASLSVRLPEDCKVGDVIQYEATVSDSTMIFPIVNYFEITVKEEADVKGGGGKHRDNPNRREKGNDREIPSGISLPNINEIHEPEWENQNPPFDRFTALRVTSAGEEAGQLIYDFSVNMDNIYLKNEQKSSKSDAKVLQARFEYSLVLLGLAMLHDNNELAATTDQEDDNEDIETKIEKISRAVAPILLPMIDTLGDLEETE